MITTVLSEELLSHAERLYRIARLRGERLLTIYHEDGDNAAARWQALLPQEKTNWLT
jgi:hypothetical protein